MVTSKETVETNDTDRITLQRCQNHTFSFLYIIYHAIPALGKRSMELLSKCFMSMSSEDHWKSVGTAKRLMGIAIVGTGVARAHYPDVQSPSIPPNAKMKMQPPE